ncbi:transposase family protein [Salmonella enterica]|nr:transposase family protein [Salmonella enterica]
MLIIPDLRQQGKNRHKLSDILFLTVCAIIAGADEWIESEDLGHERLDWLKNMPILKIKSPLMTPLDE